MHGLGLDKVILCISDFPMAVESDRSNLVERVYLVHDSEDSIPSHQGEQKQNSARMVTTVSRGEPQESPPCVRNNRNWLLSHVSK